MSELDLLNLTRSATQNELGLFTQVITINFAMVVGIYYFLHKARTPIKLFAFVAYAIGMLFFLGEMLLETSFKFTITDTLKALPHPSAITQEYIGLGGTWLGLGTDIMFNSAFCILWLGILYLMFFWKGERDAA